MKFDTCHKKLTFRHPAHPDSNGEVRSGGTYYKGLKNYPELLFFVPTLPKASVPKLPNYFLISVENEFSESYINFLKIQRKYLIRH